MSCRVSVSKILSDLKLSKYRVQLEPLTLLSAGIKYHECLMLSGLRVCRCALFCDEECLRSTAKRTSQSSCTCYLCIASGMPRTTVFRALRSDP